MRICSLLPSATEILYALGLGDHIVGVSHTCDYPQQTRDKPVVTRSVRDVKNLNSEEIDSIIQQARRSGNPVHWIDEALLSELKPDLIITQEICEVCAIDSGSVFQTAAKVLDYQPEILTSRPSDLSDIYENIMNISSAADATNKGIELIDSLQSRVSNIQMNLPQLLNPVKVFCIDWLNPIRNTGQWTPELVELAGGIEELAIKGGQTREVGWEEISRYDPDYIMVMPCAFDMERGQEESNIYLKPNERWNSLTAVKADRVFIFDGLIPSRHGPRVIDVLEGLAEAIHPEQFNNLAPQGVFKPAKFKRGL